VRLRAAGGEQDQNRKRNGAHTLEGAASHEAIIAQGGR
jgi:hypothetical protein